ncbi:MAG TPA: hypothetical protein VF510_10675 [Ktedonobacterales bacterium]
MRQEQIQRRDGEGHDRVGEVGQPDVGRDRLHVLGPDGHVGDQDGGDEDPGGGVEVVIPGLDQRGERRERHALDDEDEGEIGGANRPLSRPATTAGGGWSTVDAGSGAGPGVAAEFIGVPFGSVTAWLAVRASPLRRSVVAKPRQGRRAATLPALCARGDPRQRQAPRPDLLPFRLAHKPDCQNNLYISIRMGIMVGEGL